VLGAGGAGTAGKGNPQEAPGAYRVDVSDSGPGIAPEYLPTIFEEYVSYGDPQDRSGGGLGLAICKMIVRAHSGEIWAEVGGPGTTFSFVLPCNRPVVAEGFERAVMAG
jgi:signal transduction histidine kinase